MASTRRPGQACSSAAASVAHASTRCSQLSRINSSCLERRSSISIRLKRTTGGFSNDRAPTPPSAARGPDRTGLPIPRTSTPSGIFLEHGRGRREAHPRFPAPAGSGHGQQPGRGEEASDIGEFALASHKAAERPRKNAVRRCAGTGAAGSPRADSGCSTWKIRSGSRRSLRRCRPKSRRLAPPGQLADDEQRGGLAKGEFVRRTPPRKCAPRDSHRARRSPSVPGMGSPVCSPIRVRRTAPTATHAPPDARCAAIAAATPSCARRNTTRKPSPRLLISSAAAASNAARR